MIIKANDKLNNNGDIILANKKRIEKIKNNIENQVFELDLENDLVQIHNNLENDVFYEKICKLHTSQLKDVYSALDDERKQEYYSSLRNSYLIRGVNGFRYTCTPIIKRYQLAE